jgi:hypothetical protein
MKIDGHVAAVQSAADRQACCRVNFLWLAALAAWDNSLNFLWLAASVN